MGLAIKKSKPTTTVNLYNYENCQTPKKEYVFRVSFRADHHCQ